MQLLRLDLAVVLAVLDGDDRDGAAVVVARVRRGGSVKRVIWAAIIFHIAAKSRKLKNFHS